MVFDRISANSGQELGPCRHGSFKRYILERSSVGWIRRDDVQETRLGNEGSRKDARALSFVFHASYNRHDTPSAVANRSDRSTRPLAHFSIAQLLPTDTNNFNSFAQPHI